MIKLKRNKTYKQIVASLYGPGKGEFPCAICGHRIKTTIGLYKVHIVFETHVATPTELQEIIAKHGEQSYTGYFPISKKCLKQHPELINYIFHTREDKALIRLNDNRRHRKMRSHRQAQGLCTRCGKNPPSHPNVACPECISKSVQQKKLRKYQKTNLSSTTR